MIDRLQRVAEMIKRSISVILQTEIEDDLIEGITITYVDVTKDMRLAKVYYVCDENEKDPDAVAVALKKHSKYIRGVLSEDVALKYTPKLSFREDTLEKDQRRVDMMFEKLRAEKLIESRDDAEEGVIDE